MLRSKPGEVKRNVPCFQAVEGCRVRLKRTRFTRRFPLFFARVLDIIYCATRLPVPDARQPFGLDFVRAKSDQCDWRTNGDVAERRRKGRRQAHDESEQEGTRETRAKEIGWTQKDAADSGKENRGLGRQPQNEVRSDPGPHEAAWRSNPQGDHGGDLVAGAQRSRVYQRAPGQENETPREIFTAGWRACVCR